MSEPVEGAELELRTQRSKLEQLLQHSSDAIDAEAILNSEYSLDPHRRWLRKVVKRAGKLQ